MGILDRFTSFFSSKEEIVPKDVFTAGNTHANPMHPQATEFENPLYQAPNMDYQREGEVGEATNVQKTDQLEVLKELMQNSKKTSRFMNSSNSAGYTAISDGITEIVTKFNTTVNSTNYSDEYFNMISLFSEFLLNCDNYLESHAGARTDVGKTRLDLVSQIKTVAEKDGEAIKNCGDQIDEGNSKTWKQIIADARTEKIDLAGKDVKTIGNGGSSRWRFKQGEQTVFFSREETLENENASLIRCMEFVREEYKDLFSKFYQKSISDKISNLFDMGLANLENIDEIFVNEFKTNINQYANLTDTEKAKIMTIDENEDLKKSLTEYCISLYRASNGSYNANVLAGIEFGRNISQRNVAMSRIADLLGIGGLIAQSTNAEVTKDGKTYKGNLMEGATGEDAKPLVGTGLLTGADVSDGELQRQLVCLQMLDSLCGQVDRAFHNIFYQMERGDASNPNKVTRMTGIQGIDNDLAFGSTLNERAGNLSEGWRELNPFVDRDGNSMLDVLDAGVANRIKSITPEILRFALCDLLEEDEIASTIERLIVMQQAIQKLEQKGQTEGYQPLLQQGQWGDNSRGRLESSANKVDARGKRAGNYLSRLQETVS